MVSTVFVNGVTLTDEDWANDLNRLHYTIFGDPANIAAVRTSLYALPIDISGASAGQIVFPATQNASSNANTLDDYVEADVTLTLTGCTTAPTYVGKLVKIGKAITLSFPGTSSVTATSNAGTKTLTGVAAAYRPTGTITFGLQAGGDNGTPVIVYMQLDSSGVISLGNLGTGATGIGAAGVGGWTNSGTFTFTLPSMAWTIG